MFRLAKTFRFEASHVLPHHDGKCSRLHGHSFRGEIIVQGRHLQRTGPKQGMLIDFGILGDMAKHLEARLDHYHLNDIISKECPTSEVVAKWCYEELKGRFASQLAELGMVIVIEETCTSRCEYHSLIEDN